MNLLRSNNIDTVGVVVTVEATVIAALDQIVSPGSGNRFNTETFQGLSSLVSQVVNRV